MKKFECKICKKEFKSLGGLSAHITIVHKIFVKEYYEKYYPRFCKICNNKILWTSNTPNYLKSKTCCLDCKNILNSYLISKSLKGNIPWNKNLKTNEIKNYKRKTKYRKSKNIMRDTKEITKSLTKRKIIKDRVKFWEYRNYADTKIEKIIEQELIKNNINYEKQSLIFGYPDFKINNICIFCDGDYWHYNPKKYSGLKAENRWKYDNNITQKLKKQGYKVLRFWEEDIYHNLDNCIQQIIDLVNTEAIPKWASP